MSLRCIVVLLIKKIATKNIRMLNRTQKCFHKHNMLTNSYKTIITHRYRNLTINPQVQATYIWIDGTGENIKIKGMLDNVPKFPDDLPKWTHAETIPSGGSSEIILCPRSIYRDPFTPSKHDVIAMCDTYKLDGSPTDTNHRYAMQITVDKTVKQKPWFGIKQEYTLLDTDGYPFGWPKYGYPESIDLHYCGVGCNRIHGRDLVESHALACLYAGIDFGGTNAQPTPSQWKYHIGPSIGMKVADDLWVSRYILTRIAEEFGVCVTFHPKPIKGIWNETSVHIHYSTAAMRSTTNGTKIINKIIKRLVLEQDKYIKVYNAGCGQYDRLSSIDIFSENVVNGLSSIRIPNFVADFEKGYLKDRQPPSNVDPYLVCNVVLTTTLLNE